MAIGGANAMVPEIHRYVIEQRGWMRGDEFAALFAIAQASPGPNVLFITLIGWKVAGWPGAVASTVAMCGPRPPWRWPPGAPWRATRNRAGGG